MVSSELKGEGKAERERDVGESLLKYSDSRPPKAELHEILKKFKPYVHS